MQGTMLWFNGIPLALGQVAFSLTEPSPDLPRMGRNLILINKKSVCTERIDLFTQVRHSATYPEPASALHVQPSCKAGPEGPRLQCKRDTK